MAPKVGSKRAAAPAPNRARKAAKGGAHGEQLQAVVQAIEETEGLPVSCRAMLLALLPSSLGAAADARHPLQAHAVGLLQEAMAQARSEKEAAAKESTERAAKAQATRSELEAAKAGAEASLELKEGCAREKKAALTSAFDGLSGARAALDGARLAEQSAKDAEVAKRAESDCFSAVLAEHLAPLRAGAWDEGAAPGDQHMAALEPALLKAELDSSVMASLRISGSKRDADRTNFDKMVLEQVGVSLSEKAKKLQAELAEKAPAVTAGAAEVAAKQAEVESAEAKVQECKSAFEHAEAEKQAGEGARAAAAAALEGFMCELGAASEAQAAAKAGLELFLQGPMATFEAMRTGPKEVEAPAAAAEEAALAGGA